MARISQIEKKEPKPIKKNIEKFDFIKKVAVL